MATLLKEHKDLIVNYHVHDSLLENVEGEKLTEAERKAAWMDYETKLNTTKSWFGILVSANLDFLRR